MVDETETASDAGSSGLEGKESGAEIEPGDHLGRYAVRELIGAGGMGRVYAAFDADLSREVALKVVRPDRVGSAGRERLIREAQALARLHHPNVVSIHDVGTEGERVFIAMELVKGRTLDAWLRVERRSSREVCGVFLLAGRGLAAAHAAGIVHRDFKPQNVIVGRDRVVVVDFGLARAWQGDHVVEAAPASGEALGLDGLTVTGAAIGTPHYMAPEQRACGVVTAKADQYAFCLALKEALGAGAPARLLALAARGLAEDPDERWASMDDLLGELARDPARPRRRFAAVAAIVVGGSAAVWAVGATRAPLDPCAGVGARLAGVWDGPRKNALHTAFAATGLAYADDTWQRVSAGLDDYGARWSAMAAESCRATRVEGRQSDTLLDLRTVCLDRHRAVLGALVDVWLAGANAEALEAASGAVAGLAPLSDCADTRALTERTPAPDNPAQAAMVAAARVHLALLRALTLAHRWGPARSAAEALRLEADATGWAPIRAEAAFAGGEVWRDLNDPRAEPQYLEAYRLAASAHDDALAARALVDLVQTLAGEQQSAARALEVADMADGFVARIGDERLRTELLANRGLALFTQGKYTAALALLTDARGRAAAVLGASGALTLTVMARLARVAEAQGRHADARRLNEETLAATAAQLGAEHPRVAEVLNDLALNLESVGDHVGSIAALRRALAIREKTAGPDSPATAATLNTLGFVELHMGRLAEGGALLERALAIRERSLGADHPSVGVTLVSLAIAYRKQGRLDEARGLVERALTIFTAAYGATHFYVSGALAGIAYVHVAKGEMREALDYLRRAADARVKGLGAHHPRTQHMMVQVATTLAALGRCAEARPLLAGAAADLEKALGARHHDTAQAREVIGQCELDGGHTDAALAHLRGALEVFEHTDTPPLDRGIARWQLARALWSAGRHDAAVAAARQAESELAGDADGARDRAAAQTFLARASR